MTLFTPLEVFIIAAFFYALIWTPYELLILAVLVDIFFSGEQIGLWYQYTLVASVLYVLSLYGKPYVKFYK